MSNKVSTMSREAEGLLLEYSTIERSVEGTTVFDVSVRKSRGQGSECAVCRDVSRDPDTARRILELLYESYVLPETLLESMEECLEVV